MNSEKDPAYKDIVNHLSPDHRIIHCRAHIQWILQQCDKTGRRWRAKAFFRTKRALIRECEVFGLDASCLHRLPDTYQSPSEAGQTGAGLPQRSTLPREITQALANATVEVIGNA